MTGLYHNKDVANDECGKKKLMQFHRITPTYSQFLLRAHSALDSSVAPSCQSIVMLGREVSSCGNGAIDRHVVVQPGG